MDRLDFSGAIGAQERPAGLLKPEAFFMGCEVIFSYLRLKESDRWSEGVALLKLASFTDSFPEVSDAQFLWACERWVQDATGPGFRTFPSWRELMSPLYRRENGLANRSWGFNPNLPAFLQPTVQQLQMLPREPRSLLPSDDPSHERWLPPADSWTAADGSSMAIGPHLQPIPSLEGSDA